MISLTGIEAAYVTTAAALIELLAAVVVAWHAADALVGIARGLGSRRAQRVIGEGVLSALGFSVAATLLRTIGLEDWRSIRMFAFVLVFRTLLKRVFEWEQRQGAARRMAVGTTRASGPEGGPS